MSFPNQVNGQAAIGVAGDFASSNPRFAVVPPNGGDFQAGPAGVTIGRFAWQDAAGNGMISNTGSGPVTGFVHREQQGLITAYLSEAGMTIPAGFPVTLHNGGDFFVVNAGSTEALIGQVAYADAATGVVTFAASGSAGSASVTASIAAATGSVTGSISNNVMTVTAVGSGVVVPGGLLSGTNVATGTRVVSQISGTTGGIGTYYVSIQDQAAGSTTISETYGTMTVTAVASGVLGVGDLITSGASAGTAITALGTGTGGTGTYVVNNTQTVSSGTLVAGTTVATKWVAASYGAPGALVIISSQAFG